MVDARCDAVGSEERPFLGSFQKGGGARNGAERRAEPRSIKGGHARGAPSSLPGSRAHLGACSLLLLFLSRVHALLFSSRMLSPLHGSSALLDSRSLPPRSFPRSWPGAACWWETRTGGAAGGLWWTCACGRGECRRRFTGRKKGGFLFFGLLYVCLWRQSVK